MNFLSILGTPLGWVMWAIYQVIPSYGWALLIFIILTRLIMFPFGIKTQKSSARMAAIQPKLQQLQKQYGKDKQRYQEEMMKVYEKEGVSPMGGCLPSLIPMILLFGIIDVIYYPLKHLLHIPDAALSAANQLLIDAGTNMSGAQLSMINMIKNGSTMFNDVFTAEQIQQIQNFDMNFLGLNLGEVPKDVWGWLIIVPILAFLAQMGYTLYSMWQQKRNGQQQMQGFMKWFMLLMPLLSLWWGFTMPAGVGVYWFLSSILMLLQQIVLQKLYPPEKVLADSKANEKVREKMRRKREKMEAYSQQMAERGLGPDGKPLPKKKTAAAEDAGEAAEEKVSRIDVAKEKELNKRRLAEARRQMAEKYGDEYTEE